MGVRLRKTNGQDMLRQKNIAKELRGEGVMEKLVGIWQRVGITDHHALTLL